MTDARLDRRIAGIAVLDQPVRRALYRLLAADDRWVGRDEAAAALNVPRSVAAFHLDKLADAGVAEVRFERTTGRRGPGAGRPAKLYRRAQREVAASVPERSYDLAGSMLAGAVHAAVEHGRDPAEALAEVAASVGRALGEEAAEAAGVAEGAPSGGDGPELLGALADHGYEPRREGADVVLANCPFHRLAQEHREVVCAMNRDFLAGLLEGLGADELDARLDPQPGSCCVRVTPR